MLPIGARAIVRVDVPHDIARDVVIVARVHHAIAVRPEAG
jgi:hypothetical protein